MNIGEQIPEFSVKDYKGNVISNETLKGKNAVLFFYPKDGSPICTTEACSFRDNYEEFLNFNCEVIGISSDDDESHKKFANKHNLKFPLIYDQGNNLRSRFGVKNNILGLMPGRETFLIDETGTIRLIFNSQLSANSHIEKTLDFLKKFINKKPSI